MAYTYNNIQLDHIDSTGAVIANIGTFTAATIPALTEGFAVGNKIRLTLTIDASGLDTFSGKLLRFNPALFTNIANLTAFNFGYESNGVLTTTPTAANLNFFAPKNDNIYCEMYCDLAQTEATIVFEFYVTYDTTNFIISSNGTNNNRLIASDQNSIYTNNNPNRVFKGQRNLSIVCKVFDYLSFDADVFEPLSSKFLNIPVKGRWFNSDIDGDTTGMRYIRELEITSASQVAAGLGNLTDITATAAQTGTQIAIAHYTVTSNQLAVGEDNSVRILLRGDSFVGSVNNPAITDVRVLLFRADSAEQQIDFASQVQLSDALIPQLAVGSAQIDGAIWTPSDWFENVPNADDIEVQFTIDGTQLVLNASYYIVVNIHDSVNPDQVTTHLSPVLQATYTPPALPTIVGYLSTYNQQYSGNDLTIAPHQRIKARLEIDKTSYATALTALGLTGTWDNSVSGIICKLTNTTGVVNQVQGYLPNGIVTSDMTIITDNATDLILECIFRIAEEYAGQNTEIIWTITLNQPTTTAGITQFTQINYEQRLTVDVFENDAVGPNLLNVRFYDLADYLVGTKTEIVDICDVDQIIAEVEKDPAFTGSINLVATIYPASDTGDTNNAAIEEEEDWQPTVIQMSQLVSGKLDNVETGFLGDDFATFRINCQQLTQGQRYFVTAIAYQQFPDYCPLGIVTAIQANTQWSSFGGFGWTFGADATAFVNAIMAHPDYIGGLTISTHKLVDGSDNLVGVTQIASGNTLAVVQINTALTEVYYKIEVDAIFDSGSGNHLIRHSLTRTVPRPILNGGIVNYFFLNYVCTDLG